MVTYLFSASVTFFFSGNTRSTMSLTMTFVQLWTLPEYGLLCQTTFYWLKYPRSDTEISNSNNRCSTVFSCIKRKKLACMDWSLGNGGNKTNTQNREARTIKWHERGQTETTINSSVTEVLTIRHITRLNNWVKIIFCTSLHDSRLMN